MLATRMRMAAGFVGPYDDVPDLTHVWEPARRTLSGYTDTLVRIRNTVTAADQQFGYTSNNLLDTAAISTFLDGAIGTYVNAYNQKSATTAHDLIQSSTTRQPRYSATIKGSIPGINQVATNTGMATGSAALNQPLTVYCVAKLDSGQVNNGFANILWGDSASLSFGFIATAPAPDEWAIQAGTNLQGGPADSDWNLWVGIFNGSSSAFYQNDTLLNSGNAGTNNYSGFTLGNFSGYSLGWIGQIGMMMVCSSAHSDSQRTATQNAINDFWGVY